MNLNEAKAILKDYIRPDNSLKWFPGKNLDYLFFIPRTITIIIDGSYTADELEAISIWIRYCNSVEKSNNG